MFRYSSSSSSQENILYWVLTLHICTFYLYKIHLGLNKNKCIFIISVFMKKISLKEQNKKKFTQDTLFSKQYQRISGANNLIQWLKWLETYKDTCKHDILCLINYIFFQYIIIVCTLVWYDIMIHAANISGIMLFFHKCILIISVFMKKISLKEENKKKFTQAIKDIN
jgi:hypothetical protein